MNITWNKQYQFILLPWFDIRDDCIMQYWLVYFQRSRLMYNIGLDSCFPGIFQHIHISGKYLFLIHYTSGYKSITISTARIRGQYLSYCQLLIMFQAGLVGILVYKFKMTIIFSFIYLVLSIIFHIWTLVCIYLNIYRYIHILNLIQPTQSNIYTMLYGIVHSMNQNHL